MRRLLIAVVAMAMAVAACGDTVSEEVLNVTEAPRTGTDDGAAGLDGRAETEPTDTAAPGVGAPATTGITAEDSIPPTTEASAATEPPPPPTTIELNPVTTTTKFPAPDSSGIPSGSTTSLYAGQIDPGLQPFIAMATEDLASRLGIAAADAEVVSAVIVTWGDSSLGCPQPGMEYLQVLEEGSVIELGYNGRFYRYHSGGERTPFLCDQPLATPPIPGGGADA